MENGYSFFVFMIAVLVTAGIFIKWGKERTVIWCFCLLAGAGITFTFFGSPADPTPLFVWLIVNLVGACALYFGVISTMPQLKNNSSQTE